MLSKEPQNIFLQVRWTTKTRKFFERFWDEACLLQPVVIELAFIRVIEKPDANQSAMFTVNVSVILQIFNYLDW